MANEPTQIAQHSVSNLPDGYETLPPHVIFDALELSKKLLSIKPELVHKKSYGLAALFLENQLLYYVGVYTKQPQGIYLAFIDGAILPDPENLLTGKNNKSIRHLDLRNGFDVLSTPAGAKLIADSLSIGAERERKAKEAKAAKKAAKRSKGDEIVVKTTKHPPKS